MKIVIDIPEEMYKAFVQGSFGAKYNMYDLVGCVMNGTPLPERHGRLIDADAYLTNTPIRKSADDTWIKETYVYDSIMDTPTIIEADAPKRRKEYWEVN